jgi:2-methylisocitrate lyase-like PEP mutase family enzyme
MSASRRSALAAAADALLAAHHGPVPLVLPNAWDAASARIVEAAGFPAVATSSHAVADVLGGADDDTGDPDVIFPFLARIVGAVRIPVTGDVERGYRLSPTALVDRLLAAGLVGCNLEDSDHHGGGVLVDADRQAAFLAEVRAAADAAGVHLVVNARIDTFLRKTGGDDAQLEEAIRRGSLYLAAGADCVYPIALVDPARIRTLTRAIPGPVNVIARAGGPRLDELAELGVRRISFGGGLHRLVLDHLRLTVAGIATGSGLATAEIAGFGGRFGRGRSSVRREDRRALGRE